MDVTPAQMLDKHYLKSRAKLIDPKKAKEFGPGVPKDGGTIYLGAADASGMMVSLIQSNYTGFGSGIVPPGTGIALQNRATGFVTKKGHPNEVGPGKRPFHTIIPGFLTRGGQPLTSVPYKEAMKELGTEFEEGVEAHDICSITGHGGSCGV